LIGRGLSDADAYRGSFMAALVLIAIGIVVLLIAFRYIKRNQSSEFSTIMNFEERDIA
jgi:hypothetical protein